MTPSQEGAEAASAPTAEATEGETAPLAPTQVHSILWVDDLPANNAFEIDALQRKGVRVESVRSTADAVRVLDRGDRFDVIITDMGRTAEGRNAGLNLIRELKAQGVTQPIIVYASASAVARTRDEALRLGAYAATASATELMALLTTLGLA